MATNAPRTFRRRSARVRPFCGARPGFRLSRGTTGSCQWPPSDSANALRRIVASPEQAVVVGGDKGERVRARASDDSVHDLGGELGEASAGHAPSRRRRAASPRRRRRRPHAHVQTRSCGRRTRGNARPARQSERHSARSEAGRAARAALRTPGRALSRRRRRRRTVAGRRGRAAPGHGTERLPRRIALGQ